MGTTPIITIIVLLLSYRLLSVLIMHLTKNNLLTLKGHDRIYTNQSNYSSINHSAQYFMELSLISSSTFIFYFTIFLGNIFQLDDFLRVLNFFFFNQQIDWNLPTAARVPDPDDPDPDPNLLGKIWIRPARKTGSESKPKNPQPDKIIRLLLL